MNLDIIAKNIRINNIDKGWKVIDKLDLEEYSDKIKTIVVLIHSEISEALEAFREKNLPHFKLECADICIRSLDAISAWVDEYDFELLYQKQTVYDSWKVPSELFWSAGAYCLPTQLKKLHDLCGQMDNEKFLVGTIEMNYSQRSEVWVRYNIRLMKAVETMFRPLGFNLKQDVLNKMAINKTRKFRHGNKVV